MLKSCYLKPYYALIAQTSALSAYYLKGGRQHRGVEIHFPHSK